jgi:hypothetical protein
MIWLALHPRFTPEMLGYLPDFFSEDDPRGAVEQFDDAYLGGWHDMDGFTFNQKAMTIDYPGDPPTKALAMTILRDEHIILFDHEWLMVLQKDGSNRITRCS